MLYSSVKLYCRKNMARRRRSRIIAHWALRILEEYYNLMVIGRKRAERTATRWWVNWEMDVGAHVEAPGELPYQASAHALAKRLARDHFAGAWLVGDSSYLLRL